MITSAKDISDADFVAAVIKHGPFAMTSELIPELGAPEKVVRAKARKLIRRGIIDGCACGCRGDFSVASIPTDGRTT